MKTEINSTTSGEWTENSVTFLAAHGGLAAIAVAHNAALAAAVREAILNDVGAEGSEYIMKLEQQLAAERKGHKMDGQLISSQEVEIQQLREQLDDNTCQD